MRFVPDWLLYIVAVGAIFFLLSRIDEHPYQPPAPPEDLQAGAALPPPSAYDPEILVDTGPATSGLGTAFAISEDGWWLTSRHVVDSCEQVGIIVARGAAVPVKDRRLASFADLALLKTDVAPVALAVDTSEDHFTVGQRAYAVGFPQGRPGEAYARLVGRENLISRGRYSFEEPVLVWAQIGRTEHLEGSLAGISGGPAIGSNGIVLGVTIAESARRGRLYTASPSSIRRLLEVEHVSAEGDPGPRMRPEDYGEQADNLRRSLAVAQIICIAPADMRRAGQH
ncbi:MAG TPA: serine protease [Caulobacterales bacterium]|nr:serine protease [Caulobacterales bacterium]